MKLKGYGTCSVEGCEEDSFLEWPLLNVAVCKIHFDNPPKESECGIEELVRKYKERQAAVKL